MQSVEEAIIRILGKTELESVGIEQSALRTILEEVLYQYNIQPQCTDIVLVNDIRDKIVLFLTVKKLDGLSKNTLNSYKLHLVRFSSFTHKNIGDITVMDIRIYLAELMKQKNIKNTTLNTEISVLKSFFGWLADNEYINKSPMNQIKQAKVDKRLRKSLNQEELERLRDACKTSRQRALLEFMFSTGCRLSEIVSVNRLDLNWNDRSLKVIGKGNKERQVYFSEKAKLYIKKYMLECGINESEALFITERKPYKRLENRAIQCEISKIAKSAGFDKAIFPHLLRHTMATLALKSGASLTTIQHLLGHTDASTTQIYAETDKDTVREEYRKYLVQ